MPQSFFSILGSILMLVAIVYVLSPVARVRIARFIRHALVAAVCVLLLYLLFHDHINTSAQEHWR